MVKETNKENHMTKLLTVNGEAHGLINTIGNSVAFDDFKHMDAKTKAKCEKEKKEECKMVRARYIHKKGNNERLQKAYCRWSGEPIRLYNLIPGHVYELPYGFIKEINEKKGIQRSGLVEVDGQAIRNDNSPLDKDTMVDGDHLLIPVEFN